MKYQGEAFVDDKKMADAILVCYYRRQEIISNNY